MSFDGKNTPKPVGAKLLSRRGEMDSATDDNGNEIFDVNGEQVLRKTGPNAIGTVEYVEYYGLSQGWNYGVVFHDNGGVWVNIDESDLAEHPEDFEWLENEA